MCIYRFGFHVYVILSYVYVKGIILYNGVISEMKKTHLKVYDLCDLSDSSVRH